MDVIQTNMANFNSYTLHSEDSFSKSSLKSTYKIRPILFVIFCNDNNSSWFLVDARQLDKLAFSNARRGEEGEKTDYNHYHYHYYYCYFRCLRRVFKCLIHNFSSLPHRRFLRRALEKKIFIVQSHHPPLFEKPQNILNLADFSTRNMLIAT